MRAALEQRVAPLRFGREPYFVLLTALVLSILGCVDPGGSAAFEAFDQIRIGMTLDRVEQLLGPADFAASVSSDGIGGHCPESATRVLLFHSCEARDLSLLICTDAGNKVVARDYQVVYAH